MTLLTPNEHETADPLRALRDLAAGRGVRRGRHALELDGRDMTGAFLEALADEGFVARRLGEVSVERGDRVPGFLVRDGVAEFGWVFWEKFTRDRWRKLFGSVTRNAKGDWAVQLGASSREAVHVRLADKMAVDADRPSSLG